MSSVQQAPNIAGRIDAAIAEAGIPPVTAEQAATTVGAVRRALHRCEVCGADAECELFDGTWLCEPHMNRLVGDVAALAEPFMPGLTESQTENALTGPNVIDSWPNGQTGTVGGVTVPIVSEGTPATPKPCPMCCNALGSTPWCPFCVGIARDERERAVQRARDHIRTAIAGLGRLNLSLRCASAARDDADWDGPNAATDAMDELGLALESLSGVSS